jgi:hypothetical protein
MQHRGADAVALLEVVIQALVLWQPFFFTTKDAQKVLGLRQMGQGQQRRMRRCQVRGK